MNATISINELSIGDWLQHSVEDPRRPGELVSRPVKITGIFQEKDGSQFIIYVPPKGPEVGVCAPLNSFYPLPISEELVRLNGATLKEVGDNGAATPAQFRNRFEKWSITTKWKDGVLWYDRRIQKWSLAGCNGCNFDYVHELQHALRLVGYPWEIDAMKMYQID